MLVPAVRTILNVCPIPDFSSKRSPTLLTSEWRAPNRLSMPAGQRSPARGQWAAAATLVQSR